MQHLNRKMVLVFSLALLFAVLNLGEAVTLPASHYSKGLLKPANWEERAEYLSITKSEPLPDHFDWREKLGKTVPIKDQGSCGSCWAFSRVTTLQWQILIQTGANVAFSPQELVSCDTNQSGCGGGFWDDFEKKGISLDSEFPYTASDQRCKSGLPRATKIDKWLYIGATGRSPSKDELKQALYQYGPLGVTVSASGSFPNGCGNGGTNHMVVITGWDESKGGWYMQNSWGSNWGDNGFAIIKYGCYRIGEDAAISIINAEPEKPVTITMENSSVSLTITVQPQSGYGVTAVKTAIQKTLNAVGN